MEPITYNSIVFKKIGVHTLDFVSTVKSKMKCPSVNVMLVIFHVTPNYLHV